VCVTLLVAYVRAQKRDREKCDMCTVLQYIHQTSPGKLDSCTYMLYH
jgi:hypothetical protein